MRFKELFCWHKYLSQNQFYEITKVNNRFTLVLKEYLRCSRCGKTHTATIQTFEGLTFKELCKIKQLVQSHGATRRLN